jgi:hypothetical protein
MHGGVTGKAREGLPMSIGPDVGWNGMEASLNRRLIVCSVEFFY